MTGVKLNDEQMGTSVKKATSTEASTATSTVASTVASTATSTVTTPSTANQSGTPILEEGKLSPAISSAQATESGAYVDRDNSTSYLLAPRSVAVIGATERPNTVGRTTFENLESHYGSLEEKPFALYPVNPTRSHVLGVPCFAEVQDIPGPVDLAIIIIPASNVLKAVEQCGKKRVKVAVVLAAGFKESGPEGAKLEEQVVSMCKNYNMRLVGPNCLGVLNPHWKLNASFAATQAPKGSIAFLSQSGAMCTAMLDWATKSGVGFSAFVSIGSMADVNWADLISYIGNDPKTRAIMIYMETIGNAERFMKAAKKVTETKPIFIIKAGKTATAAAAAVSHTGSLVGSHEAFEAAMRRVGIVLIDSIQQLLECALLFDKQLRPTKRGVTIITNAGGPGVLTTDAAELAGIPVNGLPDAVRSKLDEFLPKAWSHHNPVDILGDASPEMYAKTLQVVLENGDFTGAVVVVLSPQSVTEPTGTARRLVEVYSQWRKYHPTKILPLVCAWMGGDSVAEGLKHLNSNNIPCFSNPDAAVFALGCMFKQVNTVSMISGTPLVPQLVNSQKSVMKIQEAREILTKAQNAGSTVLTESQSKEVLKCFGIKVAESVVCKTAEEARKVSSEMGFPCVVKLHSETITHKSDVGGVRLNLQNADDVEKACHEIEKSVTTLKGAEHIQGYSVQQQIDLSKGIELLVGSCPDVQLGPVCAFGSGGCMVEILKDTTLGIPPLTCEEAQLMMERTKVYGAMKGNGTERFPGVPLDKVSNAIQKFSYLIFELWDVISECEINPLLAYPGGVIALDARISITPKGETPLSAPPCLREE